MGQSYRECKPGRVSAQGQHGGGSLWTRVVSELRIRGIPEHPGVLWDGSRPAECWLGFFLLGAAPPPSFQREPAASLGELWLLPSLGSKLSDLPLAHHLHSSWPPENTNTYKCQHVYMQLFLLRSLVFTLIL